MQYQEYLSIEVGIVLLVDPVWAVELADKKGFVNYTALKMIQHLKNSGGAVDFWIPLAWALAPLLAREMSAFSVSHPHKDHNMEYFLALCHPTLLVGLRTPTFIHSSNELFSGI